jgi:hypothetical protein
VNFDTYKWMPNAFVSLPHNEHLRAQTAMFLSTTFHPLLLAGTFAVGSALPHQHIARHDAACQALNQTMSSSLGNITVYAATHYPAGTNYTNPGQLSYSTTPAANLSAFCLFGANVTTSSKSQFRFEVFLPDDWKYVRFYSSTEDVLLISVSYSGRFMMVGNGGDSGWVRNEDMALPMSE